MGITQLNFEGKNKVESAIDLLHAYEPPEGYYLAFSGGKDSVVIYDLAVKAGVKFDAHYCVSPIDPPQIYKFIKGHYPDVIWDYHARGWWKMVVRIGLPMRHRRWCCQVIKEAGGIGRLVILGTRMDESPRRKRQRCHEMSYNGKKEFVRPIHYFTYGEVWEYIRTNKLPYCELYDLGFKRIGCILCPFTRDTRREIEFFPKTALAWQRACDRIVERRLQAGKVCMHTTGQELFEWWIKRR